MRYLLTVNDGGTAPDDRMYAEMALFVEELTRAGVLLATGGLDRNGSHITSANGQIEVTDGPYAEGKELIVSFALVDVASKGEALELARRFWVIARDGDGDVHQVFGPE